MEQQQPDDHHHEFLMQVQEFQDRFFGRQIEYGHQQMKNYIPHFEHVNVSMQ